MSTHIAYALVVYTLLLIFIVSPELESEGMAIWPYFALVAMVGAVIPICRRIERRWQTRDASHSDEHESQLKADEVKLWIGAVGIPVVLMLFFRLCSTSI
jgi:hypothetical protein